MFTCHDRILLSTINGEKIIDQDIKVGSDDVVSCCAFYETLGSDWIETELIFTGHRRGVANVSAISVPLSDEYSIKDTDLESHQ